ncbi:PHP domain-containing protein [Orenia marismortui]|nr:PHP domain-containing protein [Orenia marismortui]
MSDNIMKKIDLHIHTTASDGSFTPSELLEEAKRRELSTIAITDHDTVAGIEEAIERGKELGIEVIPGIELTTYYQGQRVDILGYQIDYHNQELLAIIDNLQNSREVRAKQILAKLSNLGIELDFARLKEIAGETGVGRPHIARLMVEEEHVSEMQEAFDNYLEDGGPAYVPKYQLKPEDAIELIQGAGGIVVLAHPGIIDNNEIVKELINYEGLTGIEVYYSKHSKEETEYYLSLAQEKELIITGGSDCHGPANEDKYLLGTVDVPYSLLEELKK